MIIERLVIMEDSRIRINKIILCDLKSVSYGVIDLNSTDSLRKEKANIMGLYGQNASGKTVVIEALAIIKHAMSGEKIPHRYLESIANGKDECSIEVEFSVIVGEPALDCTAIYKCTLGRRNDPNENDENPKKIIAVINESLRARGIASNKKFILQDFARTDEGCQLILPVEKCNLLFGTDPNTLKTLEQQKILALYGSRSFIFSSQALNAMATRLLEKNNANWHFRLFVYLYMYARCQLFVVDERGSRIDFHIIDKNTQFMMPRKIPLLQSNDSGVPRAWIKDIEALLPHLNNVLSSIVPGLMLVFKSEKISLDENDDMYRLEFFSHREGLGDIPLRNESLGIKKIVSFIVLIAEVYNNPSFTLAIDEMDASIFEYLLGEILSIMSSSGKGQLLFTSHNLCPLEKLDSRFIWFTTSDPQNRYTQMTKKATNNLRDMYLRAIQLGHEDKELYNGDSKHAIAYTFRQMGRNGDG